MEAHIVPCQVVVHLADTGARLEPASGQVDAQSIGHPQGVSQLPGHEGEMVFPGIGLDLLEQRRGDQRPQLRIHRQ
jgi:hypothetical protein